MSVRWSSKRSPSPEGSSEGPWRATRWGVGGAPSSRCRAMAEPHRGKTRGGLRFEEWRGWFASVREPHFVQQRSGMRVSSGTNYCAVVRHHFVHRNGIAVRRLGSGLVDLCCCRTPQASRAVPTAVWPMKIVALSTAMKTARINMEIPLNTRPQHGRYEPLCTAQRKYS